MNRNRLRAAHVRDQVFEYATSVDSGSGRERLLQTAADLGMTAGRKGIRVAQNRRAAEWKPDYEAINDRYDVFPDNPAARVANPHPSEQWQDDLPAQPNPTDSQIPSAGA